MKCQTWNGLPAISAARSIAASVAMVPLGAMSMRTSPADTSGASVANVYLHYVFDLWAHQWRCRHARGDVVLARFADDFVAGFEHRDDAERFLADLRDRFAKFNLELAADKTRLIQFGRFAARDRAKRGQRRPETFQFLGFTHICATTRNGRFKLPRVTDKKRLRAKLSAVKTDLMRRRHLPIPDQGQWLGSVVRGHCAYYAVPDNIDALRVFREQVIWQVPGAAAPQPTLRHDLGADPTTRATMAPNGPHPAPLATTAI